MQRLGFSWWWLLLVSASFWVYVATGMRWFVLFLAASLLYDATSMAEPWAIAAGYVGIALAAATLVSFGLTAINLIVNLFGFAGLNHRYLALGTWISSMVYPFIDASALYLCLVTGLISSIVFGLLREGRSKPRIQRPKQDKVTGYICRSCQNRGTRPSAKCSVCSSANLTLVTTAWTRPASSSYRPEGFRRKGALVVMGVLVQLAVSGMTYLISSAYDNEFVPLVMVIFGVVATIVESVSSA